MLINRGDAKVQFGQVKLADGATEFPNTIDIGKGDLNHFSVEFIVDGAVGGTSATFSLLASDDNSDYSEVATSVAVPVADLAKGVNVAIPRGFNKRYLKAKVKAVSGTFTDGTVQAWVDTFVGK